jgi:hypothetical protein
MGARVEGNEYKGGMSCSGMTFIPNLIKICDFQKLIQESGLHTDMIPYGKKGKQVYVINELSTTS